MRAQKLDEDFFLIIDKATLRFTRDPSLHLAWRADFADGIVLLTREDGGVSTYRALFQTVSGATVAEGEGVDRVYKNGIDEVGGQEAVTNMWEKVQHEVDRFRLLMRLATR